MQTVTVERSVHAHHKLAAAIFVGALILSASMILSAELTKPERYEFHPGPTANTYVIFDRDTGRATNAEFNSKNPKASLAD